MKPCKPVKPKSDLHLMKPGEKLPEPSPQEVDSFIADGIRSYQRLQEQVDKELFSPNPDPEVVSPLLGQLQLVRERLAAYGIRVRA
jgi:hypothetical protein